MTRRQKLTLLATIIGSGVVFLDGSVVNLALPRMGQELHIGLAGLQWVVDAYLLSLSALILLGGSLGDIVGRKRVYLIGMAGFALASLLCGVAPNAETLIGMRSLQGLFGALMVPGSLAIIDTNFGGDKRAVAIGRWTAWTSAIVAIAPLVGGYLLDHGSWRLIFFINPPLLALCFVLGWRAIAESRDPAPRRVDWWGAVLAVVALGGLVYGLIQGPATHWQAVPVAALTIGAILMAVFLWFEHKNTDPMLELSLFRSRNFSGTNVATFAMYGALGGFFFALVIYLQNTIGFSSLKAGLSLLPVTICLLLFSGRVGALSHKYGPRLFMTLGPIVAGIGILLLLPLGKGATYVPHILPGIGLFGIGMALTVAPLTTTMLRSVNPQHSGIASAINNAVSRVSGLIVVALLGLWGASHVYRFAAVLCAGLAIGAGIISFMTIRNDAPRPKREQLQ